MDSPPFALAVDQPLTRRQLLGATAATSATVVAASLGLPAAAKALEAAAPAGLSAVQRADCLAVAQTVARQQGIGVIDVSPLEAVDALDRDYGTAQQVYRDTVDALLSALQTGKGRFASLSASEQSQFLHSQLLPAEGPTERTALLVNAVELVSHRLVSPDWEYRPGTLAPAIARAVA